MQEYIIYNINIKFLLSKKKKKHKILFHIILVKYNNKTLNAIISYNSLTIEFVIIFVFFIRYVAIYTAIWELILMKGNYCLIYFLS